MDSRMIDVALGLVLVFALTSLAVTTLHELLISVGKQRGRNLELAIRALLGLARQPGAAPDFASRLLAHPLLAALADRPRWGSGKPSYIGADVFVTALVAELAALYAGGRRPATPREFIDAVSQGRGQVQGPQPNEAFVRALAALLPGVEADWDAFQKRLCAWYDAIGERSIGWFKRATQLRLLAVGFLTAMMFNINPLVIGPRLWDDEVLRQAAVEAATRVGSAHAAALAASGAASGVALAQVVPALSPPAAASAPSAASAPMVAASAAAPAWARHCPLLAGDSTQQQQCEALAELATGFGRIGLPVGWTTANLPLAPGTAVADRAHEVRHAVQACAAQPLCVGSALAGWLITALATVLGAPFWFDLLGKLVKLRGAGTRLGDGQAGGTAASRAGGVLARERG